MSAALSTAALLLVGVVAHACGGCALVSAGLRRGAASAATYLFTIVSWGLVWILPAAVEAAVGLLSCQGIVVTRAVAATLDGGKAYAPTSAASARGLVALTVLSSDTGVICWSLGGSHRPIAIVAVATVLALFAVLLPGACGGLWCLRRWSVAPARQTGASKGDEIVSMPSWLRLADALLTPLMRVSGYAPGGWVFVIADMLAAVACAVVEGVVPRPVTPSDIALKAGVEALVVVTLLTALVVARPYLPHARWRASVRVSLLVMALCCVVTCAAYSAVDAGITVVPVVSVVAGGAAVLLLFFLIAALGCFATWRSCRSSRDSAASVFRWGLEVPAPSVEQSSVSALRYEVTTDEASARDRANSGTDGSRVPAAVPTRWTGAERFAVPSSPAVAAESSNEHKDQDVGSPVDSALQAPRLSEPRAISASAGAIAMLPPDTGINLPRPLLLAQSLPISRAGLLPPLRTPVAPSAMRATVRVTPSPATGVCTPAVSESSASPSLPPVVRGMIRGLPQLPQQSEIGELHEISAEHSAATVRSTSRRDIDTRGILPQRDSPRLALSPAESTVAARVGSWGTPPRASPAAPAFPTLLLRSAGRPIASGYSSPYSLSTMQRYNLHVSPAVSAADVAEESGRDGSAAGSSVIVDLEAMATGVITPSSHGFYSARAHSSRVVSSIAARNTTPMRGSGGMATLSSRAPASPHALSPLEDAGARGMAPRHFLRPGRGAVYAELSAAEEIVAPSLSASRGHSSHPGSGSVEVSGDAGDALVTIRDAPRSAPDLRGPAASPNLSHAALCVSVVRSDDAEVPDNVSAGAALAVRSASWAARPAAPLVKPAASSPRAKRQPAALQPGLPSLDPSLPPSTSPKGKLMSTAGTTGAFGSPRSRGDSMCTVVASGSGTGAARPAVHSLKGVTVADAGGGVAAVVAARPKVPSLKEAAQLLASTPGDDDIISLPLEPAPQAPTSSIPYQALSDIVNVDGTGSDGDACSIVASPASSLATVAATVSSARGTPWLGPAGMPSLAAQQCHPNVQHGYHAPMNRVSVITAVHTPFAPVTTGAMPSLPPPSALSRTSSGRVQNAAPSFSRREILQRESHYAASLLSAGDSWAELVPVVSEPTSNPVEQLHCPLDTSEPMRTPYALLRGPPPALIRSDVGADVPQLRVGHFSPLPRPGSTNTLASSRTARLIRDLQTGRHGITAAPSSQAPFSVAEQP